MASSTAPHWPVGSIVQKPNGGISVEWSAVGLTDDVLEEFLNSRWDPLVKSLPQTGVFDCVVDVSENQLRRPAPIAALLRHLRAAPLHTTILRLHKNRFTDVVAAALAEHIHDSATAGRPLVELHLSGNCFTSAGIRTLIEVAHSCGAYPMVEGSKMRRPLWLRAEHQRPEIADAEQLLKQCEAQGLPVCVVGKIDASPPNAVVQMHFAFLQGGCKGKGKSFSQAEGKSTNMMEWSVAEWRGAESASDCHATESGAVAEKGKWAQGDRNMQESGTTVTKESWPHRDWGVKEDGAAYEKGARTPGKWRVQESRAAVEKCAWSHGDWRDTASEAVAEKVAWTQREWHTADWRSHDGAPDWKGSAWKACEMKTEERPAESAAGSWNKKGSANGGSQPVEGSTAVGWNAKGSGKGREPKGDAKGKGAERCLYKTELCRFFERGVCQKGELCHFAHGYEELRRPGKSTTQNDQAAVQTDALRKSQETGGGDAMAWLKEHRERHGQEGAEFEAAWKGWCRDHSLNDLVKSERIASIVSFKKCWEEGLLSEASEPPPRFATHQGPSWESGPPLANHEVK